MNNAFGCTFSETNNYILFRFKFYIYCETHDSEVNSFFFYIIKNTGVIESLHCTCITMTFIFVLNSRGYTGVSTTTKGKIFFYDCVASIRYIL